MGLGEDETAIFVQPESKFLVPKVQRPNILTES